MRRAKVIFGKQLAGILSEEDNGYRFVYDEDYIEQPDEIGRAHV